jgi:predicted amidohydrolase
MSRSAAGADEGIDMRVGYIQTDPQITDVPGNLRRAKEVLEEIDADLVVLPELFNTGYALRRSELSGLAEAATGGPTINCLKDLSEDRGMAIVAGFAERGDGVYYNSAALVTPSKVRVHRKVHLFGEEKRLFEEGSSFDVHRYGGTRVGMMVCFDWFFPESCRTLMLRGAEVIAHPANLVLPFWPKAALTRAVENRVFIATASRVGSERGIDFIGSSQIVSPPGEVLASAGREATEHEVVEIDPSISREKSVTPLNDILKDRRPEAYRLG